MRYQATAKENISFGQIKAVEDDARIADAAEARRRGEVIDGAPEDGRPCWSRSTERGLGYRAGNGKRWRWAARLCAMAKCWCWMGLTAALDAEREYEIFQRFRDLTTGKIAVLISHRFSTVRMADRIAVLKVEAITGLFARGNAGAGHTHHFNMQAEGCGESQMGTEDFGGRPFGRPPVSRLPSPI